MNAIAVPQKSAEDGITVQHPVIDAQTHAAYPFVSLLIAGNDAIGCLWEHYRNALLPHVVRSLSTGHDEELQRAAIRAGALIVYLYLEEAHRLVHHIGLHSSAAENELYAQFESAAKQSGTMLSRIEKFAGSFVWDGDIDRAELDEVLVNPFTEIPAFDFENINRTIFLPNVVLEGLALQQKIDTSARMFFAPPSKSLTSDRHKYSSQHVALRLKNRLYGLMVGRIERVEHLHANRFMVTFAHPIPDHVLKTIHTEFEALLIDGALMVIVPESWMGEEIQVQSANDLEPYIPEPRVVNTRVVAVTAVCPKCSCQHDVMSSQILVDGGLNPWTVAFEESLCPVCRQVVTRRQSPASVEVAKVNQMVIATIPEEIDLTVLCNSAADALEGKGWNAPEEHLILASLLRKVAARPS